MAGIAGDTLLVSPARRYYMTVIAPGLTMATASQNACPWKLASPRGVESLSFD
jgi:hypothetical protein